MTNMRTWSVVTRLGEHVIVHAFTAKEAKQQIQAILDDVQVDDYVYKVTLIRDVNTALTRRANNER